MNNKENELIFEQYVKPRNANKHPGIAIVEALDHVMRLPRVERHGKTLVSEADLLDVLAKLGKAEGLSGPGSKNELDPEIERKVNAYRDNGMWPGGEDERLSNHAGKYPKKNSSEPQNDQPQDNQPADGQKKLDADTVTKLQDATDENGQINILDALRIIGGFQEDK